MTTNPVTRILAISSGGGHWIQLLRLRPAFEGCDVVFATVRDGYGEDLDFGRFCVIPDCNRLRKWRVAWCALMIFLLIVRIRPGVIVSTGAAPGYFAIRFGRALGIRTVWIDSVANADELSLSGRMAEPYADVWLTQWPHLAQSEGPAYWGSVL
jgi:UDP-N-acetylglucosamine:LPS N-acetylglucosamine transferase